MTADPKPGQPATLIPEADIQRLTGGLKQPRRQLAELHARGYHRARLGRDGKVILERPHYEAVAAGLASTPGARETERPRLRTVADRPA